MTPFFNRNFLELPSSRVLSRLFSNSFKAKLYGNILTVFSDTATAKAILRQHLKEYSFNYDGCREFTLRDYTFAVPDEQRKEIAANGAIIAAFHLGNFLTQPAVISECFKTPVNLLISKTNEGNIDFYLDSIRRAGGLRINIITTEKSSSMLSLLRSLQRKEIVLIYVDEMTSTQEESEKYTPVLFLDHTIRTRRGVGYLSDKLKMPVYVVTSDRHRGRNTLAVEGRFMPSPDDREKGYAEFNQKIFSILEAHVRTNPALWFKWDSFHRLKYPDRDDRTLIEQDTAPSLPRTKYRILPQRVFTFNQEGKSFCVTVPDMKVLPIDAPLNALLKRFRRPRLIDPVDSRLRDIDRKLLTALYRKECLVAS